MSATCPALQSGDLFLSSLLVHIDCQGRGVGSIGYALLSSPTSSLDAAITGLLVIFVALFGLRLALGETLTLRESVLSVVKIGVVLTLASSWPAYQVVVYDLVTSGPAQIARHVVGASGSDGSTGELIARLQVVDQSIVRFTNLGTGREEFAALPGPGAASGRLQRFPIADNPAFGWARVTFLSSAVVGFAVVRLTAGLLLALAPLFAGLLLFGLTRGAFAGWARGLVFAFLGTIALSLTLSLQAGLLAPWLSQTIATRAAQGLTATAPVELLVVCLGFAFGTIGLLGLIAFLAFSVHVPSPTRLARVVMDRLRSAAWEGAPVAPATAPGRGEEAPSRAFVISDAVAAAQRREAAALPAPRLALALAQASSRSAPSVGDDLIVPSFGQTARRARPRTSLGARLRDSRR